MENNNSYAEKIKAIREYIENWEKKNENFIGFHYDLFLLRNPVSDDKEWYEESECEEVLATCRFGIITCDLKHRKFLDLLDEKNRGATIIVKISGDFGRGWQHLEGRLIESFDILTQKVSEIDIDLYY